MLWRTMKCITILRGLHLQQLLNVFSPIEQLSIMKIV